MASSLRWITEDEEPQSTLFVDEEMDKRKGVGQFAGLEFLHVKAKRIINEVPGQSALPFRFTINAYRGCSHACVYCFARPTHNYLDLNEGADFDSKIVVKVNAVERLVAELHSSKWNGDGIAMGTNTDPYQRAEGKYRITRGLIEVLSAAANPFSILTKSTLITRDIDVLVQAAERTSVQLNFSIPTLDVDVWKQTEPGTPHPAQRVAAIKKLRAAGLDVGVLIAPILPGISDAPEQVNAVIDACVEAGATWVAASLLHLKPGVKEHWMKWLATSHPELVERYESTYGSEVYLGKEQRQSLARTTRKVLEEARQRHGQPAPVRKRPVVKAKRQPATVKAKASDPSDQASLF